MKNFKFKSFLQYLQSIEMEFSKIQWIKQKEVIYMSISVVVAVIISGLFFSIIDSLFSFGLSKIF